MNHNHVLSMLAVSCLATVPLAASADASVPNTFNNGSPADAGEVNANFTALVDAINNLDTSGGIAAEPAVGPSFRIPRGTGGAKYGTLLAEEGTDCWQARVFYQNTVSEQINTADGGTVTPDNIWRTMKACSDGTVSFDYTYGIPDAQVGTDNIFSATDGIEMDSDFETGGSFGYRMEQKIVTAGGVDTVHQLEIYEDGMGETEWVTDYSHTRSVVGSMNIGGTDFANVAITSVQGGKRVRMLAEGVGTVATLDVGASNFPPDALFIGADTVIRGFTFSRNAAGDTGTLPTVFQDGNMFGDVFH